MTAPTAYLVANLTDAIAALQSAIGNEATRKQLLRLARDLGAPEPLPAARAGVQAPPEPDPASMD